MGEQLAVMSVEKREAEARCSQLEKTLQMTQEERGALQVKGEGVENRLRDIEAMKEVSSEQQHSASQAAALHTAGACHSPPSLPPFPPCLPGDDCGAAEARAGDGRPTVREA